MTRKNLTRIARHGVLIALLLLLNGASGEICSCETVITAFGKLYPDNKVDDIQSVLERLAQPAQDDLSGGKPKAVMVTQGPPQGLKAVDLANGAPLWQSQVVPRSTVTVGREAALVLSGMSLVALSMQDGQPIWDWDMEEGWDYYGAAWDADRFFVVIGVGNIEETGSYRNGRIVALDSRTGKVLWEQQTNGGLLGRPSATRGLVFVPWDRQMLAILDAQDGLEICRLRLGDDMIQTTHATPFGVYYGGTSLYRFTPRSVSGLKTGSTVFSPALENIPGAPLFGLDSFAKPTADRSALDKIRFLFTPSQAASEADVGTGQGLFYLQYWRYLIAFDTATSTVRWTYKNEEDIEASVALPGGLLLALGSGKIVFVDALSGTESWALETQTPLATVTFDTTGFVPPPPSRTAQPDPREDLRALVLDPDNRMLPIRQFAVMLLGMSPDPLATKDLLDIYGTQNIPKPLRLQIVEALKKRQTGSEYLVEALRMRFDFLEQTEAPPMTVVAPALVRQNDKSAIPDLLAHLANHETSIDDLMATAVALVKLGDPSILGTFRMFLVRYHADSTFLQHPEPLRVVASGLLIHGGLSEKEALQQIAEDVQTLPKIKEHIRLILATPDQALALAIDGPPKPEEAAAKAAEMKEAEAKAESKPAETPAPVAVQLPDKLSDGQVSQILTANAASLKPCVDGMLKVNPRLRQIRILFQIKGDGTATGVEVLPPHPNLKACLGSAIEAIGFPAFRQMRMKATYVITVARSARYEERMTQPGYDPDSFHDPDAQGAKPGTPPAKGQPGYGTTGWGDQANPPKQ